MSYKDYSSKDASQCKATDRNIGIMSIAAYFPKTYVSQDDLEIFDKVASGKYTKGLMQDKMGFCTDLEDINSICLTVTKKLLQQTSLSLNEVGYLEVGTETLVDKSKSVKTILMDLFEKVGNTDIQGVDTTNACYGGTAALFHAIDHCSTPYWDGRLAIVVAADIAVYDKGNARPTGGCGAIAMLVGPNAPLVFSPIRASHMTNVYDFYKPDPLSEYPTVDGKLSLQAYITAVDKCYQLFQRKFYNSIDKQQQKKDDNKTEAQLIDNFDGILFHSPYCKLVRKAFARLVYDEYNVIVRNGLGETGLERYKQFEQLPKESISMAYENWMEPNASGGSLEKIALVASERLYQSKTDKSLYMANQVGNMYTASLYSCLVSYLISKPIVDLCDKSVLFFSYGSGSASSMFSARLSTNKDELQKLTVGIQDVKSRLEQRTKISPEEFTAHLEHRKETFCLASRFPTGQPARKDSFKDIELIKLENYLYPDTYYLTSVDDMFRRKYSNFEITNENNNNNDGDYEVISKKHLIESCVETGETIRSQ